MIKRNILFAFATLVLINLMGYFFYFRWDLTEDSRYSISQATKILLRDLDQPVEIDVYLTGKSLPGGFERLSRAVRETLNEFQSYGRGNISYRFIDPDAGNESDKKALYAYFEKNKITPTTVFDQKGGRKSELLVFPYAVVKTHQTEDVVLLLKSNLISSETPEEKLNRSYENIEYEFASSIQKVSVSQKPNVGLIPDFTSASPLEFRGMIDAIKDRYNLYILDTKASASFDGLDALIILAPDKQIDDITKFKIDQFVMKGGRLLLFLDGLKVDSVGLEGTFAKPLDTGLDDLLFNYGLRVNKDIVKDGLNAAVIPIVVGDMGDRPNIQEVVYRFYPLINHFGPSLITKGIGMVLTKYTSTIDTVNPGEGLKKTPLLLTSQHTKILKAPALISYNEARSETEEKDYNQGVKTVAYLVEGRFKSLFKSNFSGRDIINESEPTKILVVSDGDIIKNDINLQKETYFPLGYDKFFKYQYGNEDFLLNALAYMVDGSGVLISKSKSVAIRPLDSLKIKDNRTQLQIINVLLPILILIFSGGLNYFWIRRKYTS